MDNLVIILHEPQMAENIGAVARAMGNFALTHLRVIAPLCAVTDPKAMAMSAGAEKILEEATVYPDFESAVADIQWLYGTCATVRQIIKQYTPIHGAAPEIVSQSTGSKVGILFGPERTGLDNDILARCHQVIQIPVNEEFSSMNLAQAMVIIGYELFKTQTNPQPLMHYGETKPAPQQQIQAFLQILETKLDAGNYWRVPSKKPVMWRNLQSLFTRLQPTEQDLRSLLGVLDCVNMPANSSRKIKS